MIPLRVSDCQAPHRQFLEVLTHLPDVVYAHDCIDGRQALDDQCHQGRAAPLRLELGQVSWRHLSALAGDLEQPVLVNLELDAYRQVRTCKALRCREGGSKLTTLGWLRQSPAKPNSRHMLEHIGGPTA